MNFFPDAMKKLAHALFTQTQQQVLGLLYGAPNKSFYINEILRVTGMGVATIKRELDRLEAAGILRREKIGNQQHYQANPDCPVYNELLCLIQRLCRQSTVKTAGKGQGLAATRAVVYPRTSPAVRSGVGEKSATSGFEPGLAQISDDYHIQQLSLFGSAARDEMQEQSDIDLLVEFKPGLAPSLGGFVRLREELSQCFGGRKVDLSTPAILQNPYRREAIEKDLKVLYAAE